jgi:hypothetical protein
MSDTRSSDKLSDTELINIRLFTSVIYGTLVEAEIIIQTGALDVNYVEFNRPLIYFAAEQFRYDLVELLVRHGARPADGLAACGDEEEQADYVEACTRGLHARAWSRRKQLMMHAPL